MWIKAKLMNATYINNSLENMFMQIPLNVWYMEYITGMYYSVTKQ